MADKVVTEMREASYRPIWLNEQLLRLVLEKSRPLAAQLAGQDVALVALVDREVIELAQQGVALALLVGKLLDGKYEPQCSHDDVGDENSADELAALRNGVIAAFFMYQLWMDGSDREPVPSGKEVRTALYELCTQAQG